MQEPKTLTVAVVDVTAQVEEMQARLDTLLTGDQLTPRARDYSVAARTRLAIITGLLKTVKENFLAAKAEVAFPQVTK